MREKIKANWGVSSDSHKCHEHTLPIRSLGPGERMRKRGGKKKKVKSREWNRKEQEKEKERESEREEKGKTSPKIIGRGYGLALAMVSFGY